MQRSKSLLEINNIERPLRRKSFSWDPIYYPDHKDLPMPIQKNKNKFTLFQNYSIKLLLHIFTHITLLSLLEPIFFFQYANKIESQIFLDNLVQQFKYNKIFSPDFFNKIRQNKILYNALILFLKDNQKSFQNYNSQLYQNSINGFQNKEATNTFIQINAFQIFYFLLSILLFLCFLNLMTSKHNYLKIFTENILLILTIALYEFWFFKNIIIKFSPISEEETNRIIIHCSLNSIHQNFPELQHLIPNIPKCN